MALGRLGSEPLEANEDHVESSHLSNANSTALFSRPLEKALTYPNEPNALSFVEVNVGIIGNIYILLDGRCMSSRLAVLSRVIGAERRVINVQLSDNVNPMQAPCVTAISLRLGWPALVSQSPLRCAGRVLRMS